MSMIDKPIVIVCTGASRRDGRDGWHQEQPVSLAEIVPVAPRADLAQMAGEPAPEPTPDAMRGYGVRGTLGTMTDRGLYLARLAEARIVDGKNGPVLMLPGCPRCHERGRHVAKDGESRRAQRGEGARVSISRLVLVAEHFPNPVNVATLQ